MNKQSFLRGLRVLQIGISLIISALCNRPVQAQLPEQCEKPFVTLYKEEGVLDFDCKPTMEVILIIGNASNSIDPLDWKLSGSGAYIEGVEGPFYGGLIIWWIATVRATAKPEVNTTVTVSLTVSQHPQDPACTDNWSPDDRSVDIIVIGENAGGGSGCSSCGAPGDSHRGFASATGWNESGPNFTWGLGLHDEESDSGSLFVEFETPTLVTPSIFKLPAKRANVIPYPAGQGILEQVKSPQGLARIVDLNPNDSMVELEFYYSQDVHLESGKYVPNTGASAFNKWTISNPSGNVNIFRIAQTVGGSLQFEYSYNPSSEKWTLSYPSSGVNRTVVSWKTVSGNLINYYQEVRDGTTLLERTYDQYKVLGGVKYLMRHEEGDGNAATTRTTTYTLNESGDNLGRAKRVNHWDGRWEMFEYDAENRVTKRYESYLDIAPPAGSGFPADYASKLTEYDYGFYVCSSAELDVWRNLPRIETVKIPVTGQQAWAVVSKLYRHVHSATRIEERRCANPNADFSDPSNIVSRRDFYDFFGQNSGKVKSELFPNGTATIYEYTSDSSGTKRKEYHGEPNGDVTAIVNGTYSETTRDLLGRVLEEKVHTIKNSVVMTAELLALKAYSYSGSPLLEDYQVSELGNRVTMYNYGCCSLESVTDPGGQTTVYNYDGIRRLTGETRYFGGGSGIETQNTLDASGRILVTRRGTGANEMILGQWKYDVLGRLTRQTNALLGETTSGETVSNNKIQKTAIFPDGGTRTEDFFRDGRPAKVTGTAVHPVRFEYGAELESGVLREFKKEIKLDANGVDTFEWTKTYLDTAGRAYKTAFSVASGSPPYHEWTYNPKDQLVKERDPDGVVTLMEYNLKGELFRQAVDVDQNGLLQENGTSNFDDRITETIRDVLEAADPENQRGTDLHRTRVYVYTLNNNSTAKALTLTVETSASGLQTWTTRQKDANTPVTSSRQIVYGTGGTRTETVTNPDQTSTVSVYTYGRLTSVQTRNVSGGQMTLTSYDYSGDAHGRLYSSTDARNGTTLYTYNGADQTYTVTMPPAKAGDPSQVTTTLHDTSLRVWQITHPDQTTTTREYHPTGLLKKTFGSRSYPVEYTYSPQGRVKTMTTWRDFGPPAQEPAVTTWNYHPRRGWLESKYYADATTGAAGGSGTTYEYKDSGRLWKRTWLRGVLATYGYNSAGDLESVTYSGGTVGTPSTSITYDRRGRKEKITRNSIETTLIYNDADQVTAETHNGGTLGGFSVSRGYDDDLRETSLDLSGPGGYVQQAGYSYDPATGRLQTVTDVSAPSYTTTYAYHPNSTLINTITFVGTGGGMVTTRGYDKLNRLESIASVLSGTLAPGRPLSFAYGYNAGNQRTNMTLADASYWVYEYDTLGQVKSGKRYWSDGSQVAGQQFEYDFDHIGNRKTTGGRGSSVSTYTPNYRNQYASRTVAGSVDVTGLATAGAGVTVGPNTASRKGDYYHHALTVANGSYPTIQVSSGGSSQSGSVFVPSNPEAFGHDADGNLTSDGRWTYEWDGENRLAVMRSLAGSAAPERRITFEYDHQGRRIRQMVWNDRDDGQGTELSDTIYLYDEWNLIAELNANLTNAKLRTYVWGLDLSGTRHGAGGVGGLLKVTHYEGSTTHHFVAHDGNGNVSGLTSGTTGASTARYEYGPFGEPIRVTGSEATANPVRWSTKCTDNESGLVYYGYRYYNPVTGRWLSRDPIDEKGGLNLYGFVRNNPLNLIDSDGRAPMGWPVLPPPGYPPSFALPRGPTPCEQAIANAKAMMGNIDNDARAHCVASCQIAKACGKWVCKCLGNVKEARDLFAGGVEWTCSWVLPKKAEEWLNDHIQGGNIDDSAKDFEANDWGMGIAKSGGDCVKNCEARYGPEP